MPDSTTKPPLSRLQAACFDTVAWGKTGAPWPAAALGLIDIVATGLRDLGLELQALTQEPDYTWIAAFYDATTAMERITLGDNPPARVRAALETCKREAAYHRAVIEQVLGTFNNRSSAWNDASTNRKLRISFAELLSHLAVGFGVTGRVPHCGAQGRRLLEGAVSRDGAERYRPERPAYRYVGDMTAEIQLHMGLPLFVDTADDSVCRHLVLTGWWGPWLHGVVTKCVGRGDIVVNVGANVGYYAMLMGKCAGPHGRVFAFEPNPRLARLLRRSLRWSGLAASTTLVPMAASNSLGKTTFIFNPDHLGGGGMLFDPENNSALSAARERASRDAEAETGWDYDSSAASRSMTPALRAFDVQMTTLDASVGSKTEQIHFLLIDAEGAETLVLEGARALIRRSPHLAMVVEWASGRPHVKSPEQLARATETIEWLRADGFRFWKIGADPDDPYSNAAVFDPLSPEQVMDLETLCDIFICRQNLRQ